MQDPLLGNKIAGAALAALLLIFGLPQLTAALTGSGAHHGGGHEGELHLAYGGDIELETSAPAEEAPVVDLGTLMANASISGGERRAALCKSCHTFEQGGADGTGPNLWNIINRPVASEPGFNYTGALKAAGGVWSYERLDHFLEDSAGYIPGTAMAQRYSRPAQRADILAYLSTLSANPAPFPAPAAPAEVAEDDAAADAEHDAPAAEAHGEAEGH